MSLYVQNNPKILYLLVTLSKKYTHSKSLSCWIKQFQLQDGGRRLYRIYPLENQASISTCNLGDIFS